MAILKKQKRTEEDLVKQIEKEFDDAFEYAIGEDGKLWEFINEFDEKFEHIPAYLPLLHAAIIEMNESGISVMDSMRIFMDVIDVYTEKDDE